MYTRVKFRTVLAGPKTAIVNVLVISIEHNFQNQWYIRKWKTQVTLERFYIWHGQALYKKFLTPPPIFCPRICPLIFFNFLKFHIYFLIFKWKFEINLENSQYHVLMRWPYECTIINLFIYISDNLCFYLQIKIAYSCNP